MAYVSKEAVKIVLLSNMKSNLFSVRFYFGLLIDSIKIL